MNAVLNDVELTSGEELEELNEEETGEGENEGKTSRREVREAPLSVTFDDGTVKNFGIRGNLLSDEELTDNGVKVTWYISDGTKLIYTHIVDASDFVKKVFAEGLAGKAKASTAGSPVIKVAADGTVSHPIAEIINKKIEEYSQEIFVSRTTGGESVLPLSKLQLAWAKSKDIDVNTAEGYIEVTSFFEDKDKEYRTALRNDPSVALAWIELDEIAAAKKKELLRAALAAKVASEQ